MAKITFLGAGSFVFAKNVLGDCLLSDALEDANIALYDIDRTRMQDSLTMLNRINKNSNNSKASIQACYDRKEALRGADYIVNAVQIGGYKPCTVNDFEVPKKYGLRQTIGDTLGIGGIFRALRTIPVLFSFARDIEEVCPEALFVNYSNPMAMCTGALLNHTEVKAIGLCHSVQVCGENLLKDLNMPTDNIRWEIAGINHMAWLLKISRNGTNLYQEIKRKAEERPKPHNDMVRYEIMKQFGYYITESSEHLAEYLPYFIKKEYPDLIEKYNIPLDEYPRRCERNIEKWNTMHRELVEDKDLTHTRSNEYAASIFETVEKNGIYKLGGNVINDGMITNLPRNACVEIPCLIDGTGVHRCFIGDLPNQLAALNRSNVNVQLLTIEAAVTRKKEKIYQAAMLDPHTSSELSLDEIRALCDDMIEAHGNWLPDYN